MAKTKAKRRRKHRGTQAGTSAAPAEARRRRAERLDKPPTWRGAINRAAIAAVIVAVLAVLALGNRIEQAVILAAVMLVIYIPLGYGFDTIVYRVRQRRKQSGAGGAPPRDSERGRGGGGR